MGLFGNKKGAVTKETTPALKEKKVAKVKKAAVAKKEIAVGDVSWVIVKPRITEKAALQGDKNIYVFEVARRATKTDVMNAVLVLYKVTPTKVNIVNRVPRTVKSRARNRTTTLSGLKKAMVFLKKGDAINLV